MFPLTYWREWWRALGTTERVIACLALAGGILLVFLGATAPAMEIIPIPNTMEPLWFALIIAAPATLTPLMVALYSAHVARKAKEQDYARQDAVAARAEAAAKAVQDVATQAREAASLLVDRQDAIAAQAAEAARLLVENTKNVAQTAAATNQKLDVIHTLVNSSMTAAMQSELEATRRLVAGLVEIIDLKRKAGTDPDTAALALVKATEDRIAELTAALSDRLNQVDPK